MTVKINNQKQVFETGTQNGRLVQYRSFSVVIEDNDGIEVIAFDADDAQAQALELINWNGGPITVTDITPEVKASEVYGVDSVDKFNDLFC